MSEKYIPISDLPSFSDVSPVDIAEGRVPAFAWDFALPETIDKDRIHLNAWAVRRLHKVGAFSGAVVLDYQGEQTTFTPGVSGINADGSAIASKAGVLQEAPKSTAKLVDDPDIPSPFRHTYGRSVAVLKVNKTEAVSNISDRIREKGVTREEAWAHVLNTSIRDAYNQAAREHLVDRTWGFLRRFEYAAFSIVGATMTSSIVEGRGTVDPLIWAGLQAAVTSIDGKLLKDITGGSHIRDKRWSVFLRGHQSDRYVAFRVASVATPLLVVKK